MKSWILGLALAGLAGAVVADAQTPAQIVQERREGLRRMGQHMEAMQPVAQSRGDARALVQRIDDMIAFYNVGFVQRFPAGTQQGAPGLETRALPAIWSDMAGFQRADQGMVQALQNLRTAAASGDGAQFQTAFQAAGQACGNCHRPYRAPAR
jgi:cytochrome c556